MGDAQNAKQRFLREAIELARDNVRAGGRPFGAVVVRGNAVIARAVNESHLSQDVTDHAELLALRAATREHGPAALRSATVYASGHPCPMCLAAMRLAGVGAVAYAYSNEDGAPFDLSTSELYADLRRPFAEQSMPIRHMPQDEASSPTLYEEWRQAHDSRI
ncbi:MAG: nucleoside deaminase [Rhizobiaceae bacterium]|nr:nucleoside deaminase [Rhizobiaceae bacterium]